jgi:hypothetical protein
MPPPDKKKKTDIAALQSSFMHIPRLPVVVARDLLDLDLREVYELQGRSPEALFADLIRRKPSTPPDRLAWFRLAVYFAETPEPERAKLHPAAWL